VAPSESAIAHEKRLKRWLREWKYALIEKENPTWRDLAEDFGFEPLVSKKADPGSRPG
jgi:putative endonuclease